MKTKFLYIMSAELLGQAEAKTVMLHLNVNPRMCCIIGNSLFALAEGCLSSDFSLLVMFWTYSLMKKKKTSKADG